jgi:hypothetical protein
MRAAWGTLIAMGSYLVLGVVAAFVVGEFVDSHGTFLSGSGSGVHMMAGEVAERIRNLIGHLQIH